MIERIGEDMTIPQVHALAEALIHAAVIDALAVLVDDLDVDHVAVNDANEN